MVLLIVPKAVQDDLSGLQGVLFTTAPRRSGSRNATRKAVEQKPETNVPAPITSFVAGVRQQLRDAVFGLNIRRSDDTASMILTRVDFTTVGAFLTVDFKSART
jgi:hypothetical protein